MSSKSFWPPVDRIYCRRGFTLVELLVVIAIIAMLVSLLVPAVQAARETARITLCRNNLKQIGLAANLYHDVHSVFPTHPTGSTRRQQGSPPNSTWITQLFPFIEEQALHDLLEESREKRKPGLATKVASTPIAILNCPTRRPPITYPIGRRAARTRVDYAICGGGGDERSEGSISIRKRGIWRRGQSMDRKRVIDGTGRTYLVGEKSVNPKDYRTGAGPGDNGTILDCRRGSCIRYAFKVPGPDRPSGCFACHDFGSAHSSTWNMSFCDGSVRGMSYAMDYALHAAMSSPDGEETIASHLLP